MAPEHPAPMPNSGRDGPADNQVLLSRLDDLFTALQANGRRVVGPTVRGHAIVLTEISGAAELPYGRRTEVEAGTYRLQPGDERLAFTHTSGPQSWKQVLHPPSEQLWSADRSEDGFAVTDDPRRRADWHSSASARATCARSASTTASSVTATDTPPAGRDPHRRGQLHRAGRRLLLRVGRRRPRRRHRLRHRADRTPRRDIPGKQWNGRR